MGNGMNKVLPGLYLGNFRDAKDAGQLAENGITHILSIHDNAKPIIEDIHYLCIDASDTPGQDLTQYFRTCTQFIHEARLQGGSVMVHCLAGVSRSVTVTVAYIITTTKHNWKDALAAVKQAREVANPNFGFLEQLQKFQNESLAEEREWLRRKFPCTDNTDDERLVEELCSRYHESTQPSHSHSQRPPARDTGSSTSTFPLNGKSDQDFTSTWDLDRRSGWALDDSETD